METVIQIVVTLLGLYFGIGVLFGVYFFVKGSFLLDELIAESKWTVRLLLTPGAIGLWPVLLIKIIRIRKLKTQL